MIPLRRLCVAVALLLVATTLRADDALPSPQPVPAMQVLPLPHDQDSFQREGKEIARYHRNPTEKRPFLYPIIGPVGRSLTRMGHPQDPVGHSHHNSVWLSHHDVDGIDFWGDKGAAQIVHEKMEKYTDAKEAASLTALNAWKSTDGTVLLRDRRRLTVEPLTNDEWLLTVDLELFTDKKPAIFGKTPFGLFAVRMAKTIGVKDGGGRIRNSEGGVNEKGVFWRPARWCDYSGPIMGDAIEGITLLDHPINPNHPTVFHVRDDGWMGSSLTFDGPRTIEPGKPLRLRYALYVHAGMPAAEKIDERWKAFAAEKPPESLAPVKKK